MIHAVLKEVNTYISPGGYRLIKRRLIWITKN